MLAKSLIAFCSRHPSLLYCQEDKSGFMVWLFFFRWVVLANATCLPPTPFLAMMWNISLEFFERLISDCIVGLKLLFSSPLACTFTLCSSYGCRSEADTDCRVNKFLHLVCSFRKICCSLCCAFCLLWSRALSDMSENTDEKNVPIFLTLYV